MNAGSGSALLLQKVLIQPVFPQTKQRCKHLSDDVAMFHCTVFFVVDINTFVINCLFVC